MSNSHLSLITTDDGSHSLLNKDLNETYHSTRGAVRESDHVFIRMGLHHFVTHRRSGEVSVLEVGFGTGLNTLLTVQAAEANEIPIVYTTLEPYPLDDELVRLLNYSSLTGRADLFESIHSAPWDVEVEISPYFRIYKRKISVLDYSPSRADLIYFDAFAPSRQPEMWRMNVLKKMADALNAGGVFVTYSAMGQLKRDLRSLGLHVETLEGPPGKKEMVRATKPAESS